MCSFPAENPRYDLPEIIRMAKARGFALIQCNTNGLRLGTEPGYAASLREAGLDSVYLQCDAADDAAHEILRGRRCLPEKLEAIRASVAAGGNGIASGGTCPRRAFSAHVFVRTLPVAIRWRAARDIAGDRRGAGTAVARANPMDGFSSPGM